VRGKWRFITTTTNDIIWWHASGCLQSDSNPYLGLGQSIDDTQFNRAVGAEFASVLMPCPPDTILAVE